MPMDPRLLRPTSSALAFTQKGFSRLWGISTKSTGNISGTVESSTGSYAVKWWDNTESVYSSGDTFSKTAAGGKRAFDVYPVAEQGTSLLLPFDSSVENTSGSGATTTNNGATIDTSVKKYGAGSAAFSGGNYIELTPAGSELSLGSGDFTIEFWIYLEDVEAFDSVVYIPAGSGGTANDLVVNFRPDIGDVLGYTNCCEVFCTSPVIARNQWVHVALVRNNGSAVFYVDGQAGDPVSNSTSHFFYAGYIGGDLSPTGFTGRLDDVRITKGCAVYTSNFQKPTAQLTSTPLTYHPSGQFDGFDISDNGLTSVRAESVSLATTPGGSQYYGYPTYASIYVPGVAEQGILSGNLLSSQALNTFYGDLLGGSGDLFVTGNPGINADDPTIATTKGYTVFGSEPSP